MKPLKILSTGTLDKSWTREKLLSILMNKQRLIEDLI